MAINLASKYSSKVDERFTRRSFTQSGINREYEWSGVATIHVYSIPTVPMNDYTRSGLSRYGTPTELQDTKQDLTLTKDRAFTFTIDKGNAEEQVGVKESGKALSRQINEVVIPEVDKYRLSVMAAAAVAAGGASSVEVIDATNAYKALLLAGEYMSDYNVPLLKRVAYVTNSYYSFLKLDNSFIKASEMGQKMLVTGQVGEVDGVAIVPIPASYLPANTDFILAHPAATVAADKLTEYKTHDNPPGINGKLVEGRVIYDAFVLENKKRALYVHKNA
ncbi:N4-gp56 family major capsid protein [Paenibacillus sp. H1-7]|uniref:N4-gp56 family major capsid protein n=1 Tax=Paenibacillus sp. H1-7 TaxID=2282849 RepID=UPI001EF810F7|nr:N4-gp56 family major capsid protein [Paenibacillus sp. H1-7]ULL14354.1 N4-gp56 family major capsid protein [Paenibacillus sp. H1-7]